MTRITIRLLGPGEVTIDGASVTTFEYVNVHTLLAYLAVEAQRPHPRVELATLLRPGTSISCPSIVINTIIFVLHHEPPCTRRSRP